MSDADEQQSPETAPQIDPAQIKFALEELRSQQNLMAGLVAGLIASLVGAGVWAIVTVGTGFQIGWMAVGVGFIVGYAVRIVGKGIDNVFGVVGAVLALLGCAAGNLLGICGLIADQENMAFLEVVSRLNLSIIQEIMVATFSPMDLLFYGIAIFEGYKFSFRQLSLEEANDLLPDH